MNPGIWITFNSYSTPAADATRYYSSNGMTSIWSGGPCEYEQTRSPEYWNYRLIKGFNGWSRVWTMVRVMSSDQQNYPVNLGMRIGLHTNSKECFKSPGCRMNTHSIHWDTHTLHICVRREFLVTSFSRFSDIAHRIQRPSMIIRMRCIFVSLRIWWTLKRSKVQIKFSSNDVKNKGSSKIMEFPFQFI